jgi:hypothetical protein
MFDWTQNERETVLAAAVAVAEARGLHVKTDELVVLLLAEALADVVNRNRPTISSFETTTTSSTTSDMVGGAQVIQLFGRKGSVPPTVAAGGGDEEEKEKKKLLVLQDRLVEVIDSHYSSLHQSIDNLGCRGNCYSCPNPEATEHPGVRAQVVACLTAVVEGLDLDRHLLELED